MDPLRKEEKFEEKFQEEKTKRADTSKSAELKRETYTENPEPETAERKAFPMGPMPAAAPKGEVKEPGPRLVAKESEGAEEARQQTCFFTESESQEMRARWDKIQGSFVDQPRQAVEDADNLLGEAIKKLSEQLADERSSVIRQWNSGDSVSTEDLRQSLRRYRTFFERLMAA